jgi:hypothetical protein
MLPEIDEEEIVEPWYKGPLKYIIMLFLIMLMVMWVVSPYAIKINPEPKYIPTISEVVLSNLTAENISHSINSKNDFKRFITPNDPQLKDIAVRIASMSCNGEKVCQAKAIYYFVRDNFHYVSDPNLEYIESPKEVLLTGGSDCDGFAVLLSTLELAIGVDTRLVFVPNHVYVELKLDEGPGKYLDWFPADATCSNCKFGEIPNSDSEKQYLSLQ